MCKKQNLKPEEYDLKHHNKILDATVIFRFSGLPNNAQLELVPTTKIRSETEVILAVNLEDGSRLVGNFIPSDTLFSVLEQLCPDNLFGEKNPVVIYMRQEIYGQNLKTVSLRSLGITGGRAMLRLIDKAPEELGVQANVAALLPHKPMEEKPYIRKMKECPTEDKITSESEKISFKSNNLNDIEKIDSEKSDFVDKSKNFKKSGTIDLIKLAKEKRKNTDSSSNHEKRPNIASETNKAQVKKQSNSVESAQFMEICECKRDDTMEVDCCGKCEEQCVSPLNNDIEDQFVFVSKNSHSLLTVFIC